MRRNRIFIIIALIIGFLFGVAAGRWTAFNSRLFERFQKPKLDRKLDHFSRHLDLSPDQKEKLKVLLEKKYERIRAFHEEIAPRFNQMRETTRSEIKGLLNEEQIKKFDEMEAQWEEKRGEFGKRFGHHGPPEPEPKGKLSPPPPPISAE